MTGEHKIRRLVSWTKNQLSVVATSTPLDGATVDLPPAGSDPSLSVMVSVPECPVSDIESIDGLIDNPIANLDRTLGDPISSPIVSSGFSSGPLSFPDIGCSLEELPSSCAGSTLSAVVDLPCTPGAFPSLPGQIFPDSDDSGSAVFSPSSVQNVSLLSIDQFSSSALG